MFDEISEPVTSKSKRRMLLGSIFSLGLALAYIGKFWYTHQVDHGLQGAVWLIIAALWAYKSRHLGEKGTTTLGIDATSQD